MPPMAEVGPFAFSRVEIADETDFDFRTPVLIARVGIATRAPDSQRTEVLDTAGYDEKVAWADEMYDNYFSEVENQRPL